MNTINDPNDKATMLRNLGAQEVQRKYELRQKVKDAIKLHILANPLNLMDQNVERLTDWILNNLVAELRPAYIPPEVLGTVLGLTLEQVCAVIMFYERETGKKARDI